MPLPNLSVVLSIKHTSVEDLQPYLQLVIISGYDWAWIRVVQSWLNHNSAFVMMAIGS